MMTLSTSRLTTLRLLCGLFIYSILYLISFFFASKAFRLEMMHGMLGVVSFMVVLVYSADVITRIRHNDLDGVVILRLGVLWVWIIAWIRALTHVYQTEFQVEVANKSIDFIDDISAFILIGAAALHLIAIGMVEDRFFRGNLCIVVWSLISGCALIGALKFGHNAWVQLI